MTTVRLTTEELVWITDELINANEADRYYVNESFNNIDEEEQKDIDERMEIRSKIIRKLDRAHNASKRRTKR